MFSTYLNLGMLHLSEKLHNLTVTFCYPLCGVVLTNCCAVQPNKIDDTASCQCRAWENIPLQWTSGHSKSVPWGGMAIVPQGVWFTGCGLPKTQLHYQRHNSKHERMCQRKNKNTFSSKFRLVAVGGKGGLFLKIWGKKLELWQLFKVKFYLQKLLLNGNVFELGHLVMLYFITMLDMIVSYF